MLIWTGETQDKASTLNKELQTTKECCEQEKQSSQGKNTPIWLAHAKWSALKTYMQLTF